MNRQQTCSEADTQVCSFEIHRPEAAFVDEIFCVPFGGSGIAHAASTVFRSLVPPRRLGLLLKPVRSRNAVAFCLAPREVGPFARSLLHAAFSADRGAATTPAEMSQHACRDWFRVHRWVQEYQAFVGDVCTTCVGGMCVCVGGLPLGVRTLVGGCGDKDPERIYQRVCGEIPMLWESLCSEAWPPIHLV